MQVKKLDHINIRTTRMAETIKFYSEILGMTVTESPGGPSGAWICDDTGRAVVHLGARRSDEDEAHGSGVVDHLAFECAGHDDFAAKLDDLGLIFKRNEIEGMGLRQLFVRDPNEIVVELNFR